MSKYQLGLYEKATPTDLSWEERLSVAGESGFDYVEISVSGLVRSVRQSVRQW